MTDSAQMPLYQCHKKVRALKIVHVEKVPREYLLHVDPRTEATAQGLQVAMASASREATETFFHPIVVSDEWVSKHNPEAGGYYVQYDDGYTSYSPAKAFEEGYTRLCATQPPPPEYGIPHVLAHLKERAEWLRREWQNGGNFEYLHLKEEECLYIAKCIEDTHKRLCSTATKEVKS